MRKTMPRGGRCVVALAACAVLAACGGEQLTVPEPSSQGVDLVDSEQTSAPSSSKPSRPPKPTAIASPVQERTTAASDGTPRDASLAIPTLGLQDVAIEAYRGYTDDSAGHAIQNTGILASPHGPRGGTGPGGIGNYQVTGHRTSSTAIFEFLPRLKRGDRVMIRSAGTEYVYEVRDTRITSFRSEDSLAEQRAAVPGQPGAEPTRAMITLSTCRTPEDHAEGNYWSDEFDNPENRIDKVGVLVRTRPA